MYVRLAQFEGDPGSIDQMVAGIREQLERGETPPGLEGVQRVMVLIDRGSGKNTSLIFCATEDELRKADEALNQMTPEGGVSRTAVELLEVAIDKDTS
ncbi:MAG: hypothetical protein H0T20_05045 [Actinobacteria bacterium]|nr:hypothetical protein [Actinomycetota bacterium]